MQVFDLASGDRSGQATNSPLYFNQENCDDDNNNDDNDDDE